MQSYNVGGHISPMIFVKQRRREVRSNEARTRGSGLEGCNISCIEAEKAHVCRLEKETLLSVNVIPNADR